jgi:hypothetical protein
MNKDNDVEVIAESETEVTEFAKVFCKVQVELVNPVSYGTRKQSYLDYTVDSASLVEVRDAALRIPLASDDSVCVYFPLSNVVLWKITLQIAPFLVDEITKEPFVFKLYGQTTNGYAGWYDDIHRKCRAFLDNDANVVWLKDVIG